MNHDILCEKCVHRKTCKYMEVYSKTIKIICKDIAENIPEKDFPLTCDFSYNCYYFIDGTIMEDEGIIL